MFSFLLITLLSLFQSTLTQPTTQPTDNSLFTKISNNKNYIFVGNSERNFFEAMTYCQDEYGTSLAKMYTQQQNDEVYNVVNLYSNKPAWIGASDLFSGESNWNWIESLSPITVSEMNYTNWNITQPDD
eukprot:296235_1